ncbi:MAG: hypothetical protein QXR84_02115 [Candidatus Bathyarchaeia archaeon]|nr:hypothetical protein [Candidatus Bathyarchaeota archaeon]
MREKGVKKDALEELELGLGGGKKFRVLVYLALNPDKAFTKYALTKATGLRTPSIDRYLKTLVKIGWIKENQCEPRTYQINLENKTAKILIEFLLEALGASALQTPSPTNLSQIP